MWKDTAKKEGLVQNPECWYRFNIPMANIHKFEIKEDILIDKELIEETTLLIHLKKPLSVEKQLKGSEREHAGNKDKNPVVSILDMT
jgi:hypothetical protein